jgi:hypothetical protein
VRGRKQIELEISEPVARYAGPNWDPRRGSPDFVTETPVYTLPNTPCAMASVHRCVRNVGLWLAGRL